MQLTLWTYEGPPHIGAMRLATSMKDVHYVLHAPQGDTYADLLFTMIERLPRRPPVTYTTFQARDLGGDAPLALQRPGQLGGGEAGGGGDGVEEEVGLSTDGVEEAGGGLRQALA